MKNMAFYKLYLTGGKRYCSELKYANCFCELKHKIQVYVWGRDFLGHCGVGHKHLMHTQISQL